MIEERLQFKLEEKLRESEQSQDVNSLVDTIKKEIKRKILEYKIRKTKNQAKVVYDKMFENVLKGTFDFIGKDPDDYVTNVTKDFIK